MMCKQRRAWSLLFLSLLVCVLQGCLGIGDPGTRSAGTNSNGNTVSIVQNTFKGKIYATIGHNLVVIAGDGSSKTLVGGGKVYDPAVSPDGSKVAFVLKEKNDSILAYISTSGGPMHILIDGKGHYYLVAG